MRLQSKVLVAFLPVALASGIGMAFLTKKVVHTILVEEAGYRGLLKGADIREAVGDLFGGDMETSLLPHLQSSLENAGAVYAMAVDSRGRVLAHTNVSEQGKVYEDPVTRRALDTAEPVFQEVADRGRPVLD